MSAQTWKETGGVLRIEVSDVSHTVTVALTGGHERLRRAVALRAQAGLEEALADDSLPHSQRKWRTFLDRMTDRDDAVFCVGLAYGAGDFNAPLTLLQRIARGIR